jgi:tetratricopeptide (TPR) repeat protein
VPPLADESTLLQELQGLARQGRYREVVDRITALPSGTAESRSPLALLAAEAFGRLGEDDGAARWAERALELARTQRDSPTELRSVHLQGAIAWQRGALDEAERHFHRVLELARTLRDVAAEARAFNNLGILQNLRGEPEEALATYQLALAAYQQAGNLRGIAETHTNLEISWLSMGNARRARYSGTTSTVRVTSTSEWSFTGTSAGPSSFSGSASCILRRSSSTPVCVRSCAATALAW